MADPLADDSRSSEPAEEEISAQKSITEAPETEIQGIEKDAELGRIDREIQSGHTADANAAKVSAVVEDFMKLATEANEANESERNMTLRDAFKIYPKAVGWSVVASSSLIMAAYGTTIIGEAQVFPAFRNKLGNELLSGSWQKGVSAGANVGQILGLQIAAIMSERLGYRWTIISASLATVASVFIPVFAESLPVFVAGQILLFILWGAFQLVTVAYAAEVCPVPLRHYLAVFVFLCWVVGQLIASGVLVAFEWMQDDWGYRAPIALQWVWPVPIAIGMYLAPESPWWCVRKGHKDQAQKSLKRLTRNFSQHEICTAIALMTYINETEKQVTKGTAYWDCLKGTNLKRTENVCIVWLAYALSGAAIGGHGAILYQQAGISFQTIYDLSLGVTVLATITTIMVWLLLDRVGRKTTLFGGMCLILIILLTVGTLLLVITATANTIKPVVLAIVSEIPSIRLRAKSIALARSVYIIADTIFVSIVIDRQLSSKEWNWGLKSGFFWAGINALLTTYIYFRLPETKGRTYAELSILFINKVPARKFISTKIGLLMGSTENTPRELAIRLANTVALEAQTRGIILNVVS
ncbi:sugar transporter-domain-containing protein [Xylariaceae sp. FL1651]|nr:sugar transporter-domain-containing protein [Xylariaceae sp. FL1651]